MKGVGVFGRVILAYTIDRWRFAVKPGQITDIDAKILLLFIIVRDLALCAMASMTLIGSSWGMRLKCHQARR